MFRLSNLADYALVLLSHVANGSSAATGGPVSARDLAAASGLPAPTVSKVLKRLVRATLLKSHRGAHGGYVLARPTDGISVADVVEAFDGPVALTRCTAGAHAGDCSTPARPTHHCGLLARCPTRAAWASVNRTVVAALSQLTLQDIHQAARGTPRVPATQE